MKYSFVVLAHNDNELLKNTLEALNYQKGYGHYNAVLVDKLSGGVALDQIRGINRNYSIKYLSIDRFIYSSRVKAKNHGWKNADGEIIVFIDPGIIVRPDYLSELDRCFSLCGDIAVIGNMLILNTVTNYSDVASCRIFKNNRFDGKKLENLEFRHYLFEKTSYNINAVIDPWMVFNTCNAAIPKIWLQKAGGFDESFNGSGLADMDLGYVLSQQKMQIVINPKLEVIRQFNGNDDYSSCKKREPGDIKLFRDKHPEALKKLRDVMKILSGGKISYEDAITEEGIRNIVLNFREKLQLDSFKKLILKSQAKKNTLLIIQDYAENTDLDIWMQLPKDNGIVNSRYYPMTRRISRKDADRHLRKDVNDEWYSTGGGI